MTIHGVVKREDQMYMHTYKQTDKVDTEVPLTSSTNAKASRTAQYCFDGETLRMCSMGNIVIQRIQYGNEYLKENQIPIS